MTFLLLFGLERIFPARPARPFSKRVARNLGFWPINIALSLIVILNVTYWASGHALWHRPAVWNGGWLILGDIIILDLFLYFWHRAVHRIDFLWRFHAVHHIDRHLDTTSAIRFHFGEIFFAAFVRAIIIMAFAIPFSSVIIFETLVLMFTLFHHSNLGLPDAMDRILSKVIVTPGIHWVHHHTDVRDRKLRNLVQLVGSDFSQPKPYKAKPRCGTGHRRGQGSADHRVDHAAVSKTAANRF